MKCAESITPPPPPNARNCGIGYAIKPRLRVSPAKQQCVSPVKQQSEPTLFRQRNISPRFTSETYSRIFLPDGRLLRRKVGASIGEFSQVKACPGHQTLWGAASQDRARNSSHPQRAADALGWSGGWHDGVARASGSHREGGPPSRASRRSPFSTTFALARTFFV
jgi:hypothetical protein